jgi:hypothetical protein
MPILEITGEINAWDGHSRTMRAFPSIGERDLIQAIEDTFGSVDGERSFAVMLGYGGDVSLYGSYSGLSSVESGWTGTEVTPGDPPVILLGGLDLLDKLQDLDGTIVHLRIEENHAPASD